ncbi:MAG: hypothetical protein GY855_02380 [candidate division Zixibacteria bacterium]|nr:hypothetical protein [candidate division Zixibacteria bacterium]
MTNEDNKDCCDPSSSCCQPTPANNKSQNWKRFVFLIIIVAAVVIAAQSIIHKPSNSENNETRWGLSAIDNKYPQSVDTKFLFIVLDSKDNRFLIDGNTYLFDAMEKIKQDGILADIFRPDYGSGDYLQIVEHYKITELPAIVAVMKGCSFHSVSENLTTENYLNAFDLASTSTSCCPSSKACVPGEAGCE